MQFVILYASTAFIFLAIDAVALRFAMQPLFSQYLGDWLQSPIRMGPAVAFYLFYVVGIVYFVQAPNLESGSLLKTFLMGAFLGLLAYGTYEFTNYATLERWHWHMVAVDFTWGGLLTGTSAVLGLMITRAFTSS